MKMIRKKIKKDTYAERITDTAYQTYQNAGEMISFFLTPATVALALPIFRKLEVLHANLLPILAGALVGSAVSIVSVIGFSRLFGCDFRTTLGKFGFRRLIKPHEAEYHQSHQQHSYNRVFIHYYAYS